MKRFLALSALLALSVLVCSWVAVAEMGRVFPPIRKRERFSSRERMRRCHPC